MPPILISNGGPFGVRVAAPWACYAPRRESCLSLLSTQPFLSSPGSTPAPRWCYALPQSQAQAQALVVPHRPSPLAVHMGGGPPPAKVGVVTVALGGVDLMTE